jgi:hypothetical protein
MRDPFRDPPPPEEMPPPPSRKPRERKAKPRPAKVTNTAVLQRNFTLTSDDRIRAIVSGPPFYMRRRRQIEDLEQSILDELASFERAPPDETELVLARVSKRVAALDRLVCDHNRCYPIEANLPMDPKTSVLLDWGGAPWKPLPRPTLESMRERARNAFEPPSSR